MCVCVCWYVFVPYTEYTVGFCFQVFSREILPWCRWPLPYNQLKSDIDITPRNKITNLALLNPFRPLDHFVTRILEEPAQLYVALSRFRSLESVSISGLPSRLPRISPTMQRAVKFHESIGGAADAPVQ